MALSRLGTPAFIGETKDFQRDDQGRLTAFGERQAAAWSEMIGSTIIGAIVSVTRKGREQRPDYRCRFFNPLAFEPVGGHLPTPIVWDAFPKRISDFFDGDDKWVEAAKFEVATMGQLGSRLFEVDATGRLVREMNELLTRSHDEYLEWHEYRDDQRRITRIAFTCEPPEYYEFLGNGTRARRDVRDRAALVKLYQTLVGPHVQEASLFWTHRVAFIDLDENGDRQPFLAFDIGDYNPYNKHNVEAGLVHLTQRANTLGAEVFLGANATVLRQNPVGEPINEAARLICCSAYGEPNRSSDPSIGAGVNGIVANGGFVTLADPIGLYIGEADIEVIGPSGEDVSSGWSVVRGDAGTKRILHASFAVPPGHNFTVSDCTIGGNAIVSGGQFAERIGMVLYGQRSTVGPPPAPGQPNDSGPSPRLRCEFKGCKREEAPSMLDIIPIDRRCEDISRTEHWRDAFEEGREMRVAAGATTDPRRSAMERHGFR